MEEAIGTLVGEARIRLDAGATLIARNVTITKATSPVAFEELLRFADALAVLADTMALVEDETTHAAMGADLDLLLGERFTSAIFPAPLGSPPRLVPGCHQTDVTPTGWRSVSYLVLADAYRAFAAAPVGDRGRLELLGIAVCRPLACHPGEPLALLRALPWDLVNRTRDLRLQAYGVSIEHVAATCCLRALHDTLTTGLAAVHRHRLAADEPIHHLELLARAGGYVDWRDQTLDWFCAHDPLSTLRAAGLLDLDGREYATARALVAGWVGTAGELVATSRSLCR